MAKTITDPREEIKKEIEGLLKKHNINWQSMEIWETFDGFLVEITSPNFKDYVEAIKISKKLEEELLDPTVTISILPTS
jgi:hypothetical protein